MAMPGNHGMPHQASTDTLLRAAGIDWQLAVSVSCCQIISA